MAEPRNGIKIFVASTVYDFQPQLNEIYRFLDNAGYDVLNSHKGTVLVDSSESNLTNCLNGVKECDVFIGFIRPNYGSGVIGDKSITHMEFETAASLAIPKFVMADYRVTFARSLLRGSFVTTKDGKLDINYDNLTVNRKLMDMRCVEMYEEAIKNSIPPLDRKGNWVQEYSNLEEIITFLNAQFFYPERIKVLIDKIKQLP